MHATATAHGKVILIGEHSVVYGYHALALPTKTITISASIAPASSYKNQLISRFFTGELQKAPRDFAGIVYLVEMIKKRYSLNMPIELTISGEIPLERGLGSSAAVAIATIRCMATFFDLGLTETSIQEFANEAETINHGSASGLDVATVVSNNLIFFSKEEKALEIKSNLNAFLVITDSGEHGNTKEAVQLVADKVHADKLAMGNIKQLGILADQSHEAILAGDTDLFGAIMNQAEVILAQFQLVTPQLERLIRVANMSGASGSKISGSGLGGIVISLAKTREIAERIKNAQQNYTNNIWIEEI